MHDYITKCKNDECGIFFKTNSPHIKFCSNKCRKIYTTKKIHHKNNLKQYEKHKHTPDIPTCKICGFKSTSLIKHITVLHNMSQKTYMRKYKTKIKDIYHSSLREAVPTHGNGEIANCKNCGKEFIKESPNQVHCSVECREQFKTKIKVYRERTKTEVPIDSIRPCKQCNKPYKPKPNSRNSKFCSKKCRNRSYIEKRPGVKDKIRKCVGCGKEIKRSTTSRYCSESCKKSIAKQKALNIQKKKNDEKYKNIPNIPTCKICGIKLEALGRHISTQHNITVNEYCKKFNVVRETLTYKPIRDRCKVNGHLLFNKRMAEYERSLLRMRASNQEQQRTPPP